MNWSNFDQIYCIHFRPHKERWEGLNKEFERIELLNAPNFQFWYTDKEKRNNVATVARKHIDVYKDAIEHGYNKILVMENDIRFHNDLSYIDWYINNMPVDYDLILFDYVYGYWAKELERISILRQNNNDSKWINIGYDSKVWSCGCYALSQKMMNHIKINQENGGYSCGPDYFTTYKEESIDQEIDKLLIRYVPFNNVAIQKTYINNLRMIIRGSDNTYKRYVAQGTPIQNYNIFV